MGLRGPRRAARHLLLSEARCYVSAQGGGAPTVTMDSEQASCFVEVAYRQDDAGTFHYRWHMEFMTADGLISYLYMSETVGSNGPSRRTTPPPPADRTDSRTFWRRSNSDRAGGLGQVGSEAARGHGGQHAGADVRLRLRTVLPRVRAGVGDDRRPREGARHRGVLSERVFRGLGAEGRPGERRRGAGGLRGLAGLADRAEEGMVADRRAYRRKTFAEQLAQSLEAAGAPPGSTPPRW